MERDNRGILVRRITFPDADKIVHLPRDIVSTRANANYRVKLCQGSTCHSRSYDIGEVTRSTRLRYVSGIIKTFEDEISR